MSKLADKLMRLKQTADDRRTEQARLEGGLAAAMARLEKEFGCQTLKQARSMRDKIANEIAEAEAALEAEIAKLQIALRGDEP